MASTETPFLRDRHIKYWLRCAKTFLPEQYTPNDSNRMTLAFFIVSALDLLDVLESKVTLEERDSWVDWIYHCQLPDGGFRGFSGTDLGEFRIDGNMIWDPANVPATFFALAALLVLGDDLERVKRGACLRWLRGMQREDGSFGEVKGENGIVEGGNDLRFCCCAAGVRFILRSEQGERKGVMEKLEDIDVDGLVSYIGSCQTYEGGFSEGPLREAHSGLTYCALGALSFLNRLPADVQDGQAQSVSSSSNVSDCVRWMLQRQTTDIEEDEQVEEGKDDATQQQLNGVIRMFPGIDLGTAMKTESDDTNGAMLESLQFTGFNGRTNKIADTCYCWWNTGALSVLGYLDKVDAPRLRRYLLDKVQHVVGGFGKGIGEPPDILHAYLGLATLALFSESGIKSVDPTLCISHNAKRRLSQLAWRKTLTES